MPGVLYQCKTCGARVRARQRRAHLGGVHHDDAYADLQEGTCDKRQ